MRKKYLSALLFGALLFASTGTFTSCKDYDDDIAGLQGQIDSQATDVESKLSSMESSISSLQSAQSSLESAIAAAEDAAAAAALQAQTTAIETAQAELEAAKAELQAAIDANASASEDALNAAIAAAETAMQEIVGRISALESFRTTTEEALTNLQNASTTLQTQITTLSEETKATLTEHGQRIAALETQVAALENYKNSNDETVGGIQSDIDAINEKLGGLTTLEESISNVEQLLAAYQASNDTAVGNLTTDVAALKEQLAAAEKALSDANVNISGLDSQIADLQNQLDALANGQLTQADLDAITKQITESVSKEIEDMAKTITESVSAEIDLLSEALGKQVTHVSLYATTNDAYGTRNFRLDLESAEAVRSWTFGEGMEGAITFKEGDKETFDDSFIIRVSPINAELSKDNIKLVNSQLGDLNGLVNIESIEPYKELLTTRGVSANGLWKVTVKLADNYDADAYKKAAATYNEDGTKDDILYAVMVGESATDERQVVSEYGLILAQNDQKPRRTLSYFVDNENVKQLKNRWDGKKPTISENGGEVEYEELTWKEVYDENDKDIYAPYAEPIWDATKPNDEKNNVELADRNAMRGTDVRSYQSAYSVKAGQPFIVSLKDAEDEEYAKSIRAFYVTLDEQCAAESQPSEINAWKSYNIQGINTVTSESSIELTIPTNVNADGDYIGFRVYAVNYDGSLVDPDGRAFYVYVGETAQVGANVTVSMKNEIVTPLAATMNSNSDEFSTANWGRANKLSTVITDSEGNQVDLSMSMANVQFIDKDGNDIEWYENGRVNTNATSVKLINVPAANLKDGMTYTMTITARNSDSGIVAVGTITFTKSLPAFPASVYPFTGQLDANRNLKVYPYAVTEGEKTTAVYDMKSSWHGLVDDERKPYANLSLYEVADPGKNTLSYVTENNVTNIEAPASLVNPKDKAYGTKFPMNISYNYGPISRQLNEKTQEWEIVDWMTYYGQFTMELGNYVDDCNFTMSNNVSVNYPGAVGRDVDIKLSYITVKDWYGATINLTKIGNVGDDEREGKYFANVVETTTETPAVPFKVEFLTGANFDRVDEYFTFKEITTRTETVGQTTRKYDVIVMTSKSDAATGQPVETKIRLTFKDKFGNEIQHTVDGSFMMNFQQ